MAFLLKLDALSLLTMF